MFIESFFAVNNEDFDEDAVHEIVSELDNRTSVRKGILWIVGYGGVVLTTVVEDRPLDSSLDVRCSFSSLHG